MRVTLNGIQSRYTWAVTIHDDSVLFDEEDGPPLVLSFSIDLNDDAALPAGGWWVPTQPGDGSKLIPVDVARGIARDRLSSDELEQVADHLRGFEVVLQRLGGKWAGLSIELELIPESDE